MRRCRSRSIRAWPARSLPTRWFSQKSGSGRANWRLFGAGGLAMLLVHVKGEDSRQDNRGKQLPQQSLERRQTARERIDRRDVAESERGQRCQAIVEKGAQCAMLAGGKLEA